MMLEFMQPECLDICFDILRHQRLPYRSIMYKPFFLTCISTIFMHFLFHSCTVKTMDFFLCCKMLVNEFSVKDEYTFVLFFVLLAT